MAMNSGFQRTGEGVRLRLAAEEAAVVRSLIEQLVALINEREGSEGGEDAAGSGAGFDVGSGHAGPDEAADSGAGAAAALGLSDADFRLSESVAPPDDPALARLFPDGYQEDPDAAAEFRRYTEAGLRDGKQRDAQLVLAVLRPGDTLLDDEHAQAWLRVLNDVRLALGTRLEITEDAYDRLARMNPQDPHYTSVVVYDWLTMVQDSLVRALW